MRKASSSNNDNRANQLNPTHSEYHRSRGTPPENAERSAREAKAASDNRANQLNPTHPEYHRSRGISPDDKD